MKKVIEKINGHKIACTIKYVLVALAAASLIYGFAIRPVIDRQNRIACHVATATEARTFGDSVFEQNQANEELTEEQVAQQINSLVNQRYEANYVLCLRNNGL